MHKTVIARGFDANGEPVEKLYGPVRGWSMTGNFLLLTYLDSSQHAINLDYRHIKIDITEIVDEVAHEGKVS